MRYFPFLYAATAADSSFFWMPLTSDGFCRKFWKSPHSPCPVVPPNEAGCSSDMSNTTAFALATAAWFALSIASG